MKYYYISFITYANYGSVKNTIYRTDKKSWEKSIELLTNLPGIYLLTYHTVEITQETLDGWEKQFIRTYIDEAPLFIKRDPKAMEERRQSCKFNPDYIAFENKYILNVKEVAIG